MKRRHSKRGDNGVYLNAFQTAIEHYWELRGSVGTNSSFNYGSLENENGPKNFNPLVVQPLPVDYICEIEIVARRVLGEKGVLARHFRKYYINAENDMETKTEDWKTLDYRIRLKVGAEIYRLKLDNISAYMKARWVERKCQ